MTDRILDAKIDFPRRRSPIHRSRINFQAIKILPPKLDVRFTASQTSDEVISDGESVPQRQTVINGIEGGVNPLKPHVLANESVSLFIPIGYQVRDSFNYNEANLGVGGAVVANTLNQGGSIGESALAAITEAGNSIFDFFKGLAGDRSVGRLAAVRGADLTPGVPDNIKSALGVTARVSLNPNIRTQFSGVSLREFAFQFKLVASSANESLDIKNIIKFFRFHSYPEEIASLGAFSAGYEYPNMFKIRLLSEGDDNVFRNVGTPIKLCYLKSVSHTYNPTAAVLHKNGAPSEVDLSLIFTEYKPLSRKDVINEDDDVFYHFEGNAV